MAEAGPFSAIFGPCRPAGRSVFLSGNAGRHALGWGITVFQSSRAHGKILLISSFRLKGLPLGVLNGHWLSEKSEGEKTRLPPEAAVTGNARDGIRLAIYSEKWRVKLPYLGWNFMALAQDGFDRCSRRRPEGSRCPDNFPPGGEG